MLRVAALSLTAALLASCSSSSRMEGVAPGWANTHTGTVEPGRSRAAVRGPDTDAQGGVRPHAAPGEE
jgi:hypothetical protein